MCQSRKQKLSQGKCSGLLGYTFHSKMSRRSISFFICNKQVSFDNCDEETKVGTRVKTENITSHYHIISDNHRSYSGEDADTVPSTKSSDPMTINMKYVMILLF